LAAGQSFTDPTQDFVLTVTGPVTVNGEAGTTTAMGVEICRQACSSTPAPSGLTAEAQSTSTIQLDWTDNSGDEDGFDIQRSPDGSDWSAVTTVAPETTTYLDDNLQVGTAYYYRVRASAPLEDSGWSNTAGEQTFAVPPEAAFSYLENYLDVDFTDLSNDDGTITAWSWNFGDGADSNAQNPSHQYGSGGTRTVSLTVTDNHGESDSVSHDVTVFEPPPPPFTYHSATGEVRVAGVVSGSYTATETNNGSVQSIRERESGGKKQNRYSYLEQRWIFNLPSGGTAATVSVNAWQSVSTDGDSFNFAWSSNGNDWTTMFNMSDTSDGAPRTFELPTGIEGSVYLRVRDSDRSTGNKILDTVYVDFLQIEVSNEPPVSLDGSAPNLQPLALNPSDTLELTWADNTSNETGFRVERSTAAGGPFVERGTTGDNVVSFIDVGLEASTTYYYRVAAYKGAESMISDFESVTTPTPPPPSEISLSLSGSKNRGKHVVSLTWSGLKSDDVNIYRDGDILTTVANGGVYTDNTGNKGSATYTYQVCEAVENPACSGGESVVF
jgi:PKD repeat protein